jgi:hypothetical protein
LGKTRAAGASAGHPPMRPVAWWRIGLRWDADFIAFDARPFRRASSFRGVVRYRWQFRRAMESPTHPRPMAERNLAERDPWKRLAALGVSPARIADTREAAARPGAPTRITEEDLRKIARNGVGIAWVRLAQRAPGRPGATSGYERA